MKCDIISTRRTTRAVPTGRGTQVLDPVVVVILSAGHSVQAAAPAVALYVLTAHGLQDDEKRKRE